MAPRLKFWPTMRLGLTPLLSSHQTLFCITQRCSHTMCKTDKLRTTGLCRPISILLTPDVPVPVPEWEALGCQDATFDVATICGAVHPRCCDSPSWNTQHLPFVNPVLCNRCAFNAPNSRQTHVERRSWRLEVTDPTASLELRVWLWTDPSPSSTTEPPVHHWQCSNCCSLITNFPVQWRQSP